MIHYTLDIIYCIICSTTTGARSQENISQEEKVYLSMFVLTVFLTIYLYTAQEKNIKKRQKIHFIIIVQHK